MKNKKEYVPPRLVVANLGTPTLLLVLSAAIEGHTLDDSNYLDESDYWE